MGKKKSDIYVCFQILPYKNKANKSIFQCKFCDRQYLQNATKMESHIITQCQKVPAAIRQSYTTKPGNNGGGGGGQTGSAAGGGGGLTGLNLSLMNKHSDDMDLNELIREYSDSSASEAPEQMVVNVSVPGMFRIGKSSAAGHSGGGGRNNHNRQGSPSSGGGRAPPPKNSPPTFGGFAGSPQNLVADFNQRSMQIRAFSQLVTGLNSLNGGGGGGGGGSNGNGGGGNRKRAKLDNQNNNNNNNSLNNNYYTIGGAGSAHKILIKPSHGVPASKLPGGAAGLAARQSNGSGGGGGIGSTAATISASGGGGGGGMGVQRGKLKPPVLLSGATITKNTASLNNNLKEKLTREETIEIWRLLARAIYSSDVPLTILENEHWINVLQRIQPSLTLPSTSVLSNALLDQEYARIGQEIEEKVEKSHFTLLECVTVPGNRPDEFTLLFFLNCDDSPNPFLYKTQQVSAAYTKDNLSKIIEDVILDIGLNKVVAFMSSDISPEMEATWEILRDKFPGLLTFACVIHGLNSVLSKILTLPEIVRMIDVIKKLYTKLEKSQELRKLVEEASGKKHSSPFEQSPPKPEVEENNNLSGGGGGAATYDKFLEKWSLVGKLTSQLISEKQVYQQLLQSQPDYSRKVLDGGIDSPQGSNGGGGDRKSDRCLSNHLSSESFWTSLLSINSIIVPCLQWIEALHPNRQCMLSQVPEVFKELKGLLQSHLRNFPVDDTTKQQVQKWFLGVQRKCVNEIHYTASLLNPGQKLRGVLTEDEEAMGMEFLTYFCDSRGYRAGEILRELAEYKGMSGGYSGEKVWKLGEVVDGEKWWGEVVKGESMLGNIAVSLGRVVPSCSLAREGIVKGVGEGDEEKRERMAYIQYNLREVGREKMKRKEVVVEGKKEVKVVPKVIEVVAPIKVSVPTVTVVKQEVQVAPAPAPAKIVEKLRIKIPKKPDCESPAIDLSTRLSGCSQVSDEEEELSDDDDDSDEENESSTNRSSLANSSVSASAAARNSSDHSNSKAANSSSSSSSAAKPPPPPSSNQSSDGEDGSTKDDSSSDSDDSSSDDQSD